MKSFCIQFKQTQAFKDTLNIIHNSYKRCEDIRSAPDTLVPMSYLTDNLWQKLGFLPFDPQNPGIVRIGEFFFYELILTKS